MNIGDFYVLYCFNAFTRFNHLGQISVLNGHQRHQVTPVRSFSEMPRIFFKLSVRLAFRFLQNCMVAAVGIEVEGEQILNVILRVFAGAKDGDALAGKENAFIESVSGSVSLGKDFAAEAKSKPAPLKTTRDAAPKTVTER